LPVPKLLVFNLRGSQFGNTFKADRQVAQVCNRGVPVLEVKAFEEFPRVMRPDPIDRSANRIWRPAVAGERIGEFLRWHRGKGQDATHGRTPRLSRPDYRDRVSPPTYHESLEIKIRKLSESAHLPEYAHGPEEDAGMDLRSIGDVVLEPGVPQAIPTGLAIELPAGFEAQLRPRSGLALKHAITLPNAPATIDPGYRGEIKVILLNLGRAPYQIHAGDRIAQMVIARYEAVEWVEADLNSSTRGAGGFGSSGR
jgi:dUTP pyrophosphatase